MTTTSTGQEWRCIKTMLLTPALVLALSCGNATPVPTHAGTAGADALEGTAQADVLAGGEGDDRLMGQAGDDVIYGGSGNDQLSGGSGNDVLEGGEGDDLIDAGPGKDRLVGGPGADTFVLHIDSLGQGMARIVDFNAAEGDRIVIKGAREGEVERLMKALSIQNGTLMLRPDIAGRSATGVVRLGDKYTLEMLTKKKSVTFSVDF